MPQTIEVPRSDAPRVSVLVIAARKLEPLERSLAAIARTAEGIPVEVVIALNAASPEVAGLVRERVRGATVVESGVGLGFAGGLNLAREVAGGEYLAIVHDDSEVEPDWLPALLSRAEAEPLIGAVGGRVLDPEGVVQSAGVMICRDGSAMPIGPRWAPGVDLERPRYADFVSCSAALIRAEAWDAFGGAEERLFPSFFVDSDIGMSIRATGRVVAYEPSAASSHARDHSRYPGPLEYVRDRNRAIMIEKWGEQLADHAPAGLGSCVSPVAPEEVLRAVELCQERAEAVIEGNSPKAGTPPRPRDAGERSRRERVHLDRELEMWRGFAETADAERSRLAGELWRAEIANAQLREASGTGGSAVARVRRALRPRTRVRRLFGRGSG